MAFTDIEKIFGSNVFSDKVMKERLSPAVYAEVLKAITEDKPLSLDVAKEVAEVMKNWAVEKGATHYTHWFQPMTGITAEKHDSFIEPKGKGEVILSFSEKALVKGESDASSFPTGGLRTTFEARGYTAWDPTSYAFVKEGSLYIPTAFYSYGGEALDKKTPLLRSNEALNKQAIRILRLFGNDKAERVNATVGAEQEYFLISKEVYEKRLDLLRCGRTLFGARTVKGQELEDHYYGSIKSQVLGFMKEVDEELWKLGVYAKTEHNEVAPAQHELACVYTSANLATDHNQIVMETLKSVANKHGLVCLLHEKPFANVNGSGKHNNWSLSTSEGENLLEPGNTPEANAQFLLFLVAVISAVHKNQDLLRISVASAGNDHRLGADEAPPAIVSIFLGEELENILSSIEKGTRYNSKKAEKIKVGVSVLPNIPKDSTDRNRTSPFAFTGNKFEFRMVGSSINIGCPNFILNTIVAEELSLFADKLEKAKDFNEELHKLIKRSIIEHKDILFSGNNYSREWAEEAEKRGLLNLETTVDALPLYVSDKNVKLFEKHKVLVKAEMESRMNILLENYYNLIHIEALTALDISRKEITPAIIKYQSFLVKEINKKIELERSIYAHTGKTAKFNSDLETKVLTELSALAGKFNTATEKLKTDLNRFNKDNGILETAVYCKEVLIPDMKALRKYADDIELIMAKEFNPFPTYEDIFYSVKY